MTTHYVQNTIGCLRVVEAYRLDRYDNPQVSRASFVAVVVEAYRLDRYDNSSPQPFPRLTLVVEAYRLDSYDNIILQVAYSRQEHVVEAYRLDRYDNLHQDNLEFYRLL